MDIERYGVESCPDWMTDDIEEARGIAARDNSKLIAYTFEFSDSEVVEDHTKTGPVCSECGNPFDDNEGETMCRTCSDWIVTG